MKVRFKYSRTGIAYKVNSEPVSYYNALLDTTCPHYDCEVLGMVPVHMVEVCDDGVDAIDVLVESQLNKK